MSWYESLNVLCEELLEILTEYSSIGKPALLISHYDADGICSAAQAILLLKQLEVKFHLKIVNSITPMLLKVLKNRYNKYDLIMFLDLGSSAKELLIKHSDLFSNKFLVIVDHHETNNVEIPCARFLELNPRLLGLDGQSEACTSSMMYMLLRKLSVDNIKYAKIAITGAIGDRQDRGEKFSLRGLNKMIVSEASKHDFIKEIFSLRLPGIWSKPLIEVLHDCFMPFLPGLTGNLSACLEFVKSASITDNPEKVFFDELSSEEKKKFVSYLVRHLVDLGLDMRVINSIVGYSYIFPREKRELRDSREVSTIINACGKMGVEYLALKLCLGKVGDKDFDEIKKVLLGYRRYIYNVISNILKGRHLQVLNDIIVFHGENVNLRERVSSTIASIAASSIFPSENKIILVFAKSEFEGWLKVSLRIPEYSNLRGLDLGSLVKEAASVVNGFGGGHEMAAGALIPIGGKDKFIVKFRSLIRKSI